MSMSKRMLPKAGEWINRKHLIHFEFEGKKFQGFEGDTITSALWAAGEQVLGRSFKYHRPRGVFSLANHDINVMVTDGEEPHIRGDVVQIADGMKLTAVNTRGGVANDKTRFMEWLAPFLPVGFYYKAFHKPRQMFPFWENIIRHIAGLGTINRSTSRFTLAKQHWHADVLVIGAGPSGLSAALEATQHGLSVILVDENQQAGGSLSYDLAGELAKTEQTQTLMMDLLAQVQANPSIKLVTGAYAAGYYADHSVPLVTKEGLRKVRAKAVIVASGVFEQPPVFRNNDLPGVMMGSAMQRMLHRYAVRPCNEAVVVTANDHGYRVAMDLIDQGVTVRAVVDMRADAQVAVAGNLKSLGVTIYQGHCVYEAVANDSHTGVKAVVVCPYDELTHTAQPASSITLLCGGVAMSAGWAPAAALLYQAGTKMRFDESTQQFVPAVLPSGVYAAGKVNGIYALQDRLLDGRRAAQQAALGLGKAVEVLSVPSYLGNSPSHRYPFVPHPKGKNFIDFDEDLQLQDFFNAAQEGFDNIELMKRFTTVGMGPSQGKHSNMNAIRLLAHIRQLPIEKVGSTTARPFFHPTSFAQLGGRGLHAHRLTSLHGVHQQLEAVFVDVGAWKRPAYYAHGGIDKAEAVAHEVAAVRNGVGMIDVGTLGKFMLCGPQAATFLERFYTGKFSDMKIGTTRYAMMLDESAVVVDDGMVARLAEDQFYITASTGNAAAVYREMQRWQAQWQLNIGLINMTAVNGAINVAGPKATELIQRVMDMQAASLKFGHVVQTHISSIPVTLMRLGFVSETAYEIHVAAGFAADIWQALQLKGASLNLTPFGTEAQRTLRLEMGHPIVGLDTDGLTNPLEIGASWAIAMDKPFFVGQRSLQILQKMPLKKQLVAFTLPVDLSETPNAELPLDCNLVIHQGEITGRVTSIAYSAACTCVIGLAYVAPEQDVIGNTFDIRMDSGDMITATIVKLPLLATTVAKH